MQSELADAFYLELVKRCSYFLGPALNQLFQAYRSKVVSRKGFSQQKNWIYWSFVDLNSNKELSQLFSKFPILGHLLRTVASQWKNQVLELMARLHHDQAEIEKRLFSKPLGRLVSIEMGLSDPHHEGKSVCVLGFSSGQKLIYKPRCIRVEDQFNQFLHWVNCQDIGKPLKLNHLLARDGYGWVTFVDHKAVNTQEDVVNYYFRIGMLLALLLLLRGKDYHRSNIIADGQYPILIDHEMLFTPLNPLAETLSSKADFTVLDTGILPKLTAINKKQVDFSGLGGWTGQTFPGRRFHFENLASNDLRCKEIFPKTSRQKNSVLKNNQRVKPQAYKDDICKGFKAVYQLLGNCSTELQKSSGLLHGFADCHTRYLLRPTKVYGQILSALKRPNALKRYQDWHNYLLILKRRYTPESIFAQAGPLLNEEVRALYLLNVPHFSQVVSGRDLLLNNRPISKSFFKQSGLHTVLKHYQSFNEDHMTRQIVLIKRSLT